MAYKIAFHDYGLIIRTIEPCMRFELNSFFQLPSSTTWLPSSKMDILLDISAAVAKHVIDVFHVRWVLLLKCHECS